jgi:CheY-like chemotaxis protein
MKRMRATKSPAPSRRGRPVKRPIKQTTRQPAARKTRAVEAALAAFAHDIRTPLTGILALGELLASSDLAPRERAWAQAVKSSAEYLAQLATLAVDAAKANTNGLVLRREAFRLGRLVDGIAASLAARAETRGLTSEVRVKGALPDIVIGDVLRLRAALENLIDNAVKFTERGRIALDVAAGRAVRKRIKLTFTVTDSGIGLTPAEIKRLFRVFTQANADVAQRFGGAGLGLALVKHIAKAMGGDLTVTSKARRGATFRLTVTVDAAPAGATAHGADAGTAANGTPVRSLRILCVEDNPYGRVILNTILTELGHRPDFVGSGEDAIETVKDGAFDVVLMDITLPAMDGFETSRRIRALGATVGRVPIVGVSGRDEPGQAVAARAAGMNEYLTKPLSPSSLAQAMAAISSG